MLAVAPVLAQDSPADEGATGKQVDAAARAQARSNSMSGSGFSL